MRSVCVCICPSVYIHKGIRRLRTEVLLEAIHSPVLAKSTWRHLLERWPLPSKEDGGMGGMPTNMARALFVAVLYPALEITAESVTAAVLCTYNSTRAALQHVLQVLCSLPEQNLPAGHDRRRLHTQIVASAQGALN